MIKPRFTDISPLHAEIAAELHGESFDEGWNADSLRTTIETPGMFGYIGEDVRGEPIGFGLFRISGDEGEVITIATRPAFRGQGIAKALMQNAMAQAQLSGAIEMFLEVAVDNVGALKLYQGLGFQEAGRRKGYYKRPDGARVNALVMRLTLS